MIAYILCAILAVIFLIYQKTKSPKKVLNRPPGPTPLPVIGTSYLIDNSKSPFVSFTKLSEEYGDFYRMKLGSTECLVVSSYPKIKSILLQNGKFFSGRPDFIRYHQLFAGDRKNSLALCDWDDLQVRRRKITRTHCDPKKHSHLNKLITDVGVPELAELVRQIKVKSLESRMKREDFNVKPLVMATTFNIFCQYMCSTRFDYDDVEFQKIARTFDEIFWDVNQGYAVDFFPWLLPFYKKYMKRLSNCAHDIRKFIETRIINQREINLDEDEDETDFTDALLKVLHFEGKENEKNGDAGTKFTRDSILFILEDLLGGNAAIGNTIMICLAHIAKNPHVGEKIREEVYNATEGLRPPTIDDTEYLPYTIATLKETLRIQSSPIVPHVAMEDVKIDGYDIEKGTVVIINNYKVNTDETLWKEPAKFDPERFLDRTYVEIKNERRGSEPDSGVETENEENRDDDSKMDTKQSMKYTTHFIQTDKTFKKEIVTLKQNLNHFFPFSFGKRSCLGQGLQMKYGMLSIATLLQNFEVSSQNPEQVKTYPACMALPPDTFGLTLTPRVY